MAEHETSRGASDEWYTPPEIFAALGLTFDLDPAHPGLHCPLVHVPTRRVLSADADGLSQPWSGLVWLNPPFGGRNGQVPWLRKFLEHGNGIALVAARTSAGWFQDYAVRADSMLFPRGKTEFIRGAEMSTRRRNGEVLLRPVGSIGKSPGTGIVLLGMGKVATEALRRCGEPGQLGFFTRPAASTPPPTEGAQAHA